MSDEEFVRQTYPEAGAVRQNNGNFFVRDVGGSKMSPGGDISGRFKRESDAWADAARRLREAPSITQGLAQ